jgi:replicative DNA helicase
MTKAKTTLPHSEEGERSLITHVLLDGAPALCKCFEGKITPEVFYDPVCQKVWKSICWLHKQGHPVELAVLAEELKKAGKLDELGGYEALTTVTSGQDISKNLDYWIARLRELYVLRELHGAATRTAEKALAYSGSVEDFVSETHRILSIQHAAQKALTLPEAATSAQEQCLRIRGSEPLTEEDKGLSWGWKDWDDRFGCAKAGELLVLGARPGCGKSSIARQVAWEWSKGGKILLFSREMPVEGLPVLFAQALSGKSWKEYRNRRLHDKDMDEFDDALAAVSRNPNILAFDKDRTLSQLMARIQACRQLMPIRAVVVDYLQRYDPQQERGETRDIAIGRFSMALKDVAVDLKIPVLLLVQVSRGVEKEDREPRLSDIRECLSVKDTYVFNSQGIWRNTEAPIATVGLSQGGSLVASESRNAPREDAPEMIRITLQSGRTITCTPRHAIKTDNGWTLAEAITKESAIACARRIPAPRNCEYFHVSRWMGWMLGNGSGVGSQSPSFITSCEVVAQEFCKQTWALFGFYPKPHRHKCQKVFQYDITKHTVRTSEGNPATNWMRKHDMWGRRSWEKRIPQWFCETADNRSLAELIAGLWETDGCVMLKPRPSLSYSTTSEHMAWQAVWALLRLGIYASIEPGYMGKKAKHPCFKVCIRVAEEVARFAAKIPLIGRKGELLRQVDSTRTSNIAGSRFSVGVGQLVESIRKRYGLTHAQIGYRFQGKRISYDDLMRVWANLMERGMMNEHIQSLVGEDVFWDKPRKIERVAGGPVFDRVVPEHHNFVANGVIVHNSGNVEQDADRCIFIHAPTSMPDGNTQDLNDSEVRRIYTTIIQAKGRGEGRDKFGMWFNRPITAFEQEQKGLRL